MGVAIKGKDVLWVKFFPSSSVQSDEKVFMDTLRFYKRWTPSARYNGDRTPAIRRSREASNWPTEYRLFCAYLKTVFGRRIDSILQSAQLSFKGSQTLGLSLTSHGLREIRLMLRKMQRFLLILAGHLQDLCRRSLDGFLAKPLA